MPFEEVDKQMLIRIVKECVHRKFEGAAGTMLYLTSDSHHTTVFSGPQPLLCFSPHEADFADFVPF